MSRKKASVQLLAARMRQDLLCLVHHQDHGLADHQPQQAQAVEQRLHQIAGTMHSPQRLR